VNFFAGITILVFVFFGWVELFMRTEINQQHHDHSNSRRGTIEELAQGLPKVPENAL
jgi:hypothetical protein